MKIVGFVPGPDAAPGVVAWCRAFVDDEDEVEFLCWEQHATDGRTREAVGAALGEWSAGVATLVNPQPIEAVAEHCHTNRADALISQAFPFAGRDAAAVAKALVHAAPCFTFVPLFGECRPDAVKKVLVITFGTAHDRAALETGCRFARRGAHVTAAIIEQDLGEGTAVLGEREIDRLIREAAAEDAGIETKVIVDSQPVRGVLRAVEDHDLVILPVTQIERVRSIGDALGGATVGVVKRAPPLQMRSFARWIPRVNPTDYAELVQNLRQGSRWNADFVVMLGLASAIASFGLLQNSPAVVIGSMLLAPLMTPMIGLGLALAQANMALARVCGRSIGLGFLVTLAISYLAGVITPAESLSPETLARGEPNVLDLGIALGAAIAASFALARPSIAGAIAGVAIATALVPPVCAIGLSLAQGEPMNALGATVLFTTNLIAIIFASFMTYRAMGVTNKLAPPRERKRALASVVVIVAAIAILAVPLRIALSEQIRMGRTQPIGAPVSRAVATAVMDRVDQDDHVHVILAARSTFTGIVVVWVASDRDLPKSYKAELAEVVRTALDDPEQKVKVFALRLAWEQPEDD